MSHLTTVQIQSQFKIKILGQNRVYGEDLGLKQNKNGATMWFPEDLENTPFHTYVPDSL